MPFVRCQDPPLSFLDWATPPHRTDAKAKGVAEKAQPIASPPTTSQKDQGGARPTLNRGSQTQESKTITNSTKAVYKPAKRQSPPPSLYIPPSPRSYDKGLPVGNAILNPTTRPLTLPALGTAISSPFKMIPITHLIIAGRLQHFVSNWMMLTKDTWIHNTIQGLHILLVFPPDQSNLQQSSISRESKHRLNQELQKLLDKGIITPTDNRIAVFLSPIFMIPKKNGEQRLIINLRKLNKVVKKQHFKMEGTHLLRDLLMKEDWMVKVDLKEAYYAIPIHKQSQSLLGFLWNSKPFQFTCLPFGLSCAPRVFTKVLKPVVAYLREKGIRLIIHIDDILIMAQSRELAQTHSLVTLDLLEMLGFLINYPKCILYPTQVIEFLGFVVNSREMKLYLPQEGMMAFATEATTILNSPRQVSARQLARTIGLLSATIPAILPAPLHYHNLHQIKNKLVLCGGYKNKGPLTEEAQQELRWWLQFLCQVNGRAI